MSKTNKNNSNIKSIDNKVLLSAGECAEMCGITRRSWFRYASSGKTPACIRLNSSPKWRRRDIELWILWGLPARSEFEQLKKRRRVYDD